MAIREKGHNRYQLIVDTKDNFGNRKRKTKVVTAKGTRELNRLYKEFERECGDVKVVDTCTVKELLDNYISQCEINGLSCNTIRGYKTASKRLISAFGKVLAKDLTSYQVEQFITSEVKIEAHSPKTISNTISLLSSAYTHAIKTRLLNENPCDYVTLPKKKKPDIRYLKDDEVKRFTECLYEEPLDNRVALGLALFCGLRKSEILGLTEKDINKDFSTVSVNKTRHEDGSIQETKTSSSKRKLKAPSFLMEWITELIEEHHNLETGEFLIQYCTEPMKHGYLTMVMENFTEKNNFDIALHGLRHTFATMLINSGEFDIAEVSAALGHASINITLSTYTHVFEKASHSARRIADFTEKYGAKKAHDENIEEIAN